MELPQPASPQRRLQRDRGAVLPIIAILLPALLLMTAFAVDLGRQRSSRRTMQARADIVALDMVRLADGRTEEQILGGEYGAALADSADRNDVEVAKLTVAYGTVAEIVAPDGEVTGLGPFIETLGNGIPNAVKVTATEVTDYVFRPGTGGATRSAIATTAREAGFQIGSKLATVDTQQAGLLNALLNDTLATNLALDAATYNGLIGSGVNAGRLATQLGLGSPEELANANVGAQDLLLASAQVLQQDGQTASANALNLIAARTDEDAVVDMGQVLQVAAGGGRKAAVDAGLDVFNLLVGSAYAVNGEETIGIPSLGVNIPNMASTTIGLNVIERPRAIFGPVGTEVTTQQAKITLANTLTTQGLTLGTVNVTGTISLVQSVAGATGRLNDIECGSNPGIAVGVAPQPIGTSVVLNLSIRALNLLGLPGLEVARVRTSLAALPQGTSAGGSFDYTDEFLPPVGTGTMIAAPTTPLGLADLLQLGTTDVTVLGVLPLPLGTLVNGLNNTLIDPLLTTLDPLLTGPISNALGLSIGAADIGALNMTCDNVKLIG